MSDGGERGPRPPEPSGASEAPSAHRRPGYPLSGCVPAEPDSVSPGRGTVISRRSEIKSKRRRCARDTENNRCTHEPWWARIARRCGPLLGADYHKTVATLEGRIEEAIAEIIVKMGLKRVPLLPARHTMHLMAKAAVAVYEAAVENSRPSEK